MALERVAFLPFGLLIDKWRWEVFSGAIPEDQWNGRWWELRQEYQAIVPPTPRSEEFFDPGAKYHVPANTPYIGYFFAHILEFQFYRSLCVAAGQFNPNDPSSPPLHKCDFYGSTAAGDLMRTGLEIGTSQTWQAVLQVMTGSSDIDGSALIDYFRPLQEYLDEENARFTVESNDGDSIAIILGAVKGGALLIALIAAISYFFIKKRRGIPHADLNKSST